MRTPLYQDEGSASPFTEGWNYLKGGSLLLKSGAGLFIQIAVFFSVPALTAAAIAVAVPVGAIWKTLLLFFLQSVTTAVAPVVFMMGVKAVSSGEDASFLRILRLSLPWVPRYIWTNLHTSIIFWIPVGALVVLQNVFSDPAPLQNVPHPILVAVFGVVTLIIAVVLHSHTLLAPFLAVHGDLPSSLAALESWRLARKHLPLLMTTLVLASLPAVVPLVCVGFVLASVYSQEPALAIALPYFTGVVLQCIRLPLMPAMYVLYQHLWSTELERRSLEGQPPVPQSVQRLMALSAWRPDLRG